MTSSRPEFSLLPFSSHITPSSSLIPVNTITIPFAVLPAVASPSPAPFRLFRVFATRLLLFFFSSSPDAACLAPAPNDFRYGPRRGGSNNRLFLTPPSEDFVPGMGMVGAWLCRPNLTSTITDSGSGSHCPSVAFTFRQNGEETELECQQRKEDILYSSLPAALEMYKSHRVADFTPFQCRMCKNKYRTMKGLRQHLRSTTRRGPSCKVWQETIETTDPAPESLQVNEQEEPAMEFVDADDDEDDKNDKDRLL
ncbi:hypothetical protein NM208_g7076 [Fusarium decemcellulare]|uniref:Uncharacterized protein n=1 Tax=Fusarium decemcellulare TaxID=57161 RepID=A0ACC1SAP4_9HYPO|nr:hypothetical protein NM208_g7076 [Fusarium decemcellulare]